MGWPHETVASRASKRRSEALAAARMVEEAGGGEGQAGPCVPPMAGEEGRAGEHQDVCASHALQASRSGTMRWGKCWCCCALSNDEGTRCQEGWGRGVKVNTTPWPSGPCCGNLGVREGEGAGVRLQGGTGVAMQGCCRHQTRRGAFQKSTAPLWFGAPTAWYPRRPPLLAE